MAAAAHTDLEHIPIRKSAERDDAVEWPGARRQITGRVIEKPPIDLAIKLGGELLRTHVAPPVVAHRVGFPPGAIQPLPIVPPSLWRQLGGRRIAGRQLFLHAAGITPSWH